MKSNVVCQKDIAESLGVSINTVSHALRGLKDISADTIEKVRQKAIELGYVPNSMAIKLKTGSSKMIALVYDNLTNPYFTIMASLLFDLIKKNGFDTIIFPCRGDIKVTAKTLNELIALQVDGVLSFLDIDEKLIGTKALKSLPIVLVGRLSECDVTCVYTDDFLGGQLIGRHFLSIGIKKVLFVSVDEIETSSRRLNGLKESYKDVLIYQWKDGKDTNDLIEIIRDNGIDGVFCFNDVIAAIVNRELKNNKLEKVKVAGFDNIYGTLPFFHELTSVQCDYSILAETSVNALMDIIKKYLERYTTTTNRIMIPMELHIKKEK